MKDKGKGRGKGRERRGKALRREKEVVVLLVWPLVQFSGAVRVVGSQVSLLPSPRRKLSPPRLNQLTGRHLTASTTLDTAHSTHTDLPQRDPPFPSRPSFPPPFAPSTTSRPFAFTSYPQTRRAAHWQHPSRSSIPLIRRTRLSLTCNDLLPLDTPSSHYSYLPMPPKRKTAEELHALSHPRSKRGYKETNWVRRRPFFPCCPSLFRSCTDPFVESWTHRRSRSSTRNRCFATTSSTTS